MTTATALQPVSTITFLSWIFGPILDAHKFHLNVWTMPDRASHFYTDLEQAAKLPEQLLQAMNVYFGLGALSSIPQASGKGQHPRGEVAHMGAIGCLWADIDIAGPHHKKANLPATEAEARELLDQVLPPSILVHSGHGLQAYWLLDQPIIMDNDQARDDTGALTKAWHDTLQSRAARRGWKLDSVFDLTRVLRLPGSQNVKDPANPKPVQILSPIDAAPVRYSRADIEAQLIEIPAPAASIFQDAAPLPRSVNGNGHQPAGAAPGVLPRTRHAGARHHRSPLSQ